MSEGQTQMLCVCVFTRQSCPAHGWMAGNNPAVQREGRGPARLQWSVCHSGLSESPRPSRPTETNTEVATFNMLDICTWITQTFAGIITVV